MGSSPILKQSTIVRKDAKPAAVGNIDNVELSEEDAQDKLREAERGADTKKAKFEDVRYDYLRWMARIVPLILFLVWACLIFVWVATILGEDKSPAVLVDMLDTMLIAILVMPSAAFAVIYTRAFPSKLGMSSGESGF